MTHCSTPARGRRLAILVAAASVAYTATAQQSPAPAPSAEKQRMIELGVEHETAAALYEHLKQKPTAAAAHVAKRSGLDRHLDARSEPVLLGSRPGFADGDADGEAHSDVRERVTREARQGERGVEFDPLSNCEPAGMPRWIVEPFLKEWVVTPQQT